MQVLEYISIGHWLIAVSVILLLYTLNALWIAYGSSLKNIPGPFLAKFTQLWLFYKTSKFQTHKDYRILHERYGNLVRVSPNKVSVADPAMIPIIYKVGGKFNKSTMYDAFKGMYHGQWLENVFATRDPHFHKEVRGSIAQKYSLATLKQMEPLVDQCSNIFIDSMKGLTSTGQPIDLGEWVQWYALDVIGQITFMKRFGLMEKRKDELKILDNLESANFYATLVAQLPGLNDWILGNPIIARLAETNPILMKTNPQVKTNRLIKEAMSDYDRFDDGEKRGDFLGFLRQQQEKDPERVEYQERQIMSNLSVNIIAGSDTTGISLRAIFYYLIKTPGKLQKLVDEIETADRAGELSPSVTFQEANNLNYLQAVIKESLRLCPALGLPLERVVPPEGADISGVFLPGGTIVGINAWVVQYDKNVYGADADSFRPERWLEASEEQHKAMERSFFAFGAGSRICLGKNISMLEMCKFVPQVLRFFEMEWASDQPEWTQYGKLLCKQTGVIVKMKERKREAN